jgi:RNA polymerase sigma-70 factor (ECF subfamily)
VGEQTGRVQHLLDRLRQGDEEARKELINASCERLRSLAHIMIKDYPRLRRWEETADVLQNALLRLYRALQTLTPPSPRDFYRLAALEVRRELLDLARHYFGPHGEGENRQSQAGRSGSGASVAGPGDLSLEPGQLALWSEFHQQVSALPEEEREVFDLIWYQDLSQTEAAQLLGVCARTVKRRWQSACLKLHEGLKGEVPVQ